MIVDNERVNNEFYTCPVYNYLIAGSKIGIYEIPFESMHGIGTPVDLRLLSNKRLQASMNDPLNKKTLSAS